MSWCTAGKECLQLKRSVNEFWVFIALWAFLQSSSPWEVLSSKVSLVTSCLWGIFLFIIFSFQWLVLYSLRCPVLLKSKFITAGLNGERALQPWQAEKHLPWEAGMAKEKERGWNPISHPIFNPFYTEQQTTAEGAGYGECIGANAVQSILSSISCSIWWVVLEANLPSAAHGEQGVHMSAQENSLEHELIIRPLMHEVICFIIAAKRLLMHQWDAAAWEPSGN